MTAGEIWKTQREQWKAEQEKHMKTEIEAAERKAEEKRQFYDAERVKNEKWAAAKEKHRKAEIEKETAMKCNSLLDIRYVASASSV